MYAFGICVSPIINKFVKEPAWFGIFAVVIGALGIGDLAAWLHGHRTILARTLSRLKNGEEFIIEAPPLINRALRREVLFYTRKGICESIDMVRTCSPEMLWSLF